MTTNDRHPSNHSPRALRDAATTRQLANDIINTAGALAARPLDEPVADEMRRVLGRAQDPDVRAAVVRWKRRAARRRDRWTRSQPWFVRGEES